MDTNKRLWYSCLSPTNSFDCSSLRVTLVPLTHPYLPCCLSPIFKSQTIILSLMRQQWPIFIETQARPPGISLQDIGDPVSYNLVEIERFAGHRGVAVSANQNANQSPSRTHQMFISMNLCCRIVFPRARQGHSLICSAVVLTVPGYKTTITKF